MNVARTDREILADAAMVLTRGYRSDAFERLFNAMIKTAEERPQTRPMRTLGETCLSIYCRELPTAAKKEGRPNDEYL